MKKILMICPFPFVQDRGSPLLVYNFVTALSELGHSIDLICPPYGKDPEIKNVNVYTTFKLTKSIPIGFYFSKPFYDFLLLLKAFLLRTRNHYDIIHGQHIEGAIVGLLVKGKLPLYYTIHSMLSEEVRITRLLKAKIFQHFFLNIEKIAYRKSNKLFLISPSFLEIVGKYTVESKCFFVPDIYKKHKIKTSIVEKINSMFPNKVKFMYTGNLSVYQGIDILIESFIGIDATLIVVGGHEDQIMHFKAKADNINLKNVHFFGQQPIEDQDSYLASADVLVSPRLEGSNIPSKLYKYIQSEKPIILTNIPAHTQLEKQAFLYCEPNSTDLSQKVKMMCDIEIRKNYQEGIVSVSPKFARTNFVKLVEKYY